MRNEPLAPLQMRCGVETIGCKVGNAGLACCTKDDVREGVRIRECADANGRYVLAKASCLRYLARLRSVAFVVRAGNNDDFRVLHTCEVKVLSSAVKDDTLHLERPP